LLKYDPDYSTYAYDQIVDYQHPVPELEALIRQAMVLHNQYPWRPADSELTEVGKLKDEDYVVAFYPRNNEVLQFIRRAKHKENSHHHAHLEHAHTLALSEPVKPWPPVVIRDQFRVMPQIEAISVYKGEIPCSNEDLIRNTAYCWSHMTANEIFEKTGIAERCYTELSLPEMALIAAREALAKSGRKPAEISAVLFCSCTSTNLVPSVATWLSGELGLYQTHASCDIVAACAGMSYGLGEAVRLLQETGRPVLLICGEKFSDKIGTVRTSRMIFGDGVAAVILGPAPADRVPDIEVVQTYASGPWSEVNSIIWPNPMFDNSLTVYGPEVKALVKRYLTQMIGELKALPHPDGGSGTLMDAIDLVVPHQANRNMVASLSEAAGISADRLYFNIERVGNTSAASILLAIHDAVKEKKIDRPMRIFAPGFGAGAVGGYVVMRVDPAVVQFSSQEKNIMETLVAHNGNGHNGNGFHSLKGKVALVTGASRGIGRAIALELAHRGANVAIDYHVDATHANQVAEEIRSLGVECLIVHGDVGSKEDARRIVKEVVDKWQRLDILVNNAGITRDHSMRKMTDEDWAEVIN
ncbi:MAG TPA: SDR family NAD(P)-dependent oxidoreductase, partial [Terriglobales bacterium]|nr:SDR family NAD(P)-dependent oxidoreductase [Terriglobales bacterium]